MRATTAGLMLSIAKNTSRNLFIIQLKFNILKELWHNLFKDLTNKCALDNKSVIWAKTGGKKTFFFFGRFLHVGGISKKWNVVSRSFDT